MNRINKDSNVIKNEILKEIREQTKHEDGLCQKFLKKDGFKDHSLDLLLLDLSIEANSKIKTTPKRYAIILAAYMRQTQKKRQQEVKKY